MRCSSSRCTDNRIALRLINYSSRGRIWLEASRGTSLISSAIGSVGFGRLIAPAEAFKRKKLPVIRCDLRHTWLIMNSHRCVMLDCALCSLSWQWELIWLILMALAVPIKIIVEAILFSSLDLYLKVRLDYVIYNSFRLLNLQVCNNLSERDQQLVKYSRKNRKHKNFSKCLSVKLKNIYAWKRGDYSLRLYFCVHIDHRKSCQDLLCFLGHILIKTMNIEMLVQSSKLL